MTNSFRSLWLISALCLLMGWVGQPRAQAQTAHFSYMQSTIPTSALQYPAGVAVDSSGNVYIVDTGTNRVLKETLSNGSYTESTIGNGLSSPDGVAVDSAGNVYIVDTANDRVLKETLFGGSYTQSVIVTGLNFPSGIAVDSAGNLYIADSNNNRVVKETLSGSSYTQSVIASGLNNPANVAVDSSGDVYITDSGNGRVLEELPAPSGGTYTQSPIITGLTFPTGIAVDAAGNLYVADSYNNGRILKETLSSGTYTQSVLDTDVQFPQGVAVDASGNVYIADNYNFRVVELEPGAVNFGSEPVGSTSAAIPLTFTFDSASTIGAPVVLTQSVKGRDFADAGTGTCDTNGVNRNYAAGDACTVDVTFTPKYAGQRAGAVELTSTSGAVIATAYIYGTGTGPQIAFTPATQSVVVAGLSPASVAVDGAGDVYITLSYGGKTTTGNVPTLLKETLSHGSYAQSVIANSSSASTITLGQIAVDGAGNVYAALYGDNAVFKWTPSGGSYTQNTFVSGLHEPMGVAVDGAGSVYIADTENFRVLKETFSSGSYSQSAALGGGSFGSVAVDGAGNIYTLYPLADQADKFTFSGGSYTQTVIGSGLSNPSDIAVDSAGDVYIADTGNNRVLKETPSGGSYIQSTIGSGLNDPIGVAVDSAGDVYIADTGNDRVVKEDVADPPSLSFAATAVGSTSSDSPKMVTVENRGNAALTFPAPSSGSNPAIATDFTLDSQTSCPDLDPSSSAGTLAAGASCAIGIDFVPAAPGSISGSAVLTDNNLNAAAPGYAQQTIALSGTASLLTFLPAALPAATLGTVYSQNFSVSNGTGSFTYSVGSGLPAGLTLSSSGTLSGTPTAAGSFSFVITATGSSVTSSEGYTLVVNKAVPIVSGTTPAVSSGQAGTSTVTVTGASGVIPTGTVTYAIDSGASQSAALVNGSATVSISGTLATGAHTINLTYSGDANYAAATGTVQFTVGTATPAVTWTAPAAITYGTALSTTQLDATAAYNGTAVSGTFTYSPAAGTVLSAGTHTLSVSFKPTDTTTYSTPAAVTVGITVNPAKLTAAANNATRVYGAANPAFAGTVTGAVNNDTFTETFSTSATQTSSVGQYAIVPSATGANLADYTVTATNGTLTVTQAASTTTLSASAASINPGQNLTLTAQVADASTGSTGTPTGAVSFYNGTTLLGTGTLVGGTATYTTTSSFTAGTTLALSASYAGDTNFTSSTSSSTVSVPVVATTGDFSFNVTGPSSQTVVAGNTVSFTFAISPTNQTYPGSVTFSVAGAYSAEGVKGITISPTTIAANGGPQTVTMTITTRTETQAARLEKNTNPFKRGAPLALAFLFFPLVGFRRVRKTWIGRGAKWMLLLAAGIAVAASLSSCFLTGFNVQGVENNTITVTATSGSVQHTVTVALQVDQPKQ